MLNIQEFRSGRNETQRDGGLRLLIKTYCMVHNTVQCIRVTIFLNLCNVLIIDKTFWLSTGIILGIYKIWLQLECQSGIRTHKINLLTNQKGYGTFETTIGWLSEKRIQIYPDYFCLGNILKVILNNFQNNA